MFVAKIVLLFILTLLFIASNFIGVDSKLTVYDENQKATTINTLLLNAVRWDITNELNEQFPIQNATTTPIPFIDISKSYGDYDVCDERTLNARAIESLILSKGFNPAEKWIAVVDKKIMSEQCDGKTPFHFMYAPYISLSAQNLGANCVVINGNNKLFNMFVNVDAVKKEVFGVNIRIPVLTFAYSKIPITINTTSPIYIYSKNDIQVDQDPLNEVYTSYGSTRLVLLVMGFCSIAVLVFAVIRTRKLVKHFENKKEHAQRKQLQVRLLIVIPEFISCFVRFFTCFDFLGFQGYVTFFQSRSMLNLVQSISVFTDIVLIFYCLDVFNVFKGSRRMQRTTPFLIKYKLAIQIITVIGFAMIIVDQVVLYLGLYGMLGGDNLILPILYIIVVTLIVILILGMISNSMIQEVNKSVGCTTIGSTKQTSQMVQNILDMRRNIFGTIICRLLLLVTLVSVGTKTYNSNSTIYTLTFGVMIGSSLLSSYLQVLSASAVVVASPTRKRSSITKVSVSVSSIGSVASISSISSFGSSKLPELSESPV
jgi:hypothetical protein